MIELRQENEAGAGPAAVIECAGHADAENLVRCVDMAVRLGHTRVVVDLRGRDGADSDLLGVLHRSAGRLRETGGKLAVVTADSRFTRLLQLTLLSQGFHVCATREEALAG
ncbi:MAG TPA: STAS domain-containing protein [Gaiellaceae bacterium]|nr:STAS domain-containing protein [Gaiellaceae bacterium]